MKKTRVALWSVLTTLCALLLVASFVANFFANQYATTLNVALNTSYSKVVNYDPAAMYFTSDFASDSARWEYEKELCAVVEAEGAALLKNDNAALPLPDHAKVSLFARGSVDLMYGGTGSGSVDTSAAPTLKDALTAEGIEINQSLWDWYVSVASKYSRKTPAAISDQLAANTQYAVNEAPWSEVESANAAGFAEYGDAAIVVFSRSGGEGADLPDGDASASLVTNTNVSSQVQDGQITAQESSRENAEVHYGVGLEGDGDYLALSQEERDLLTGLKALKDNGTFRRIVVLLNTSNAIELDFLNPEICGADYGIDACMWIGDVGQTGAVGVGRLLSGTANPSGSLVDTFWYDNFANPAVVNFYTIPYQEYEQYGLLLEGADVQGMYSVYQEGIYLGYRYAETRYEDVVMGTGNAGGFDYSRTVAFPFGYGLSYTTFQFSDFDVAENGSSFDVSVTVTNTGDRAGKKTVQVYFQSPYTDYDRSNGIEKAAVELCGFAKTAVLEPGAAENVTISIPKRELRTYDASGAGTYILDAGDYFFTIANGSHEAVNNILSAKGYADRTDSAGNGDLVWTWNNPELDTTTYAVSEATGNPIGNLFDESDPNRSSLNPGNVTFLSRADWLGTFPTARAVLTANPDLAAALAFNLYNAADYADTPMPVTASGGKMSISEMIGASYDDARWEALLDQLTFDEMVTTITLGFHNTAACESVSKAATKDENGPQGLTASLTGGASAMCYTSEDVMAATMNVELMEDVGRCIGNDCLDMGYSGLYGPGINMHRTPYSGRNFEYYSEDPFVAGAICTAETRGIQSKGVYVYLKHVALNDSESSRRGVNTWLTEQTAREIYLEVADRAIIDGGAWCVMSGFNRWGTQWSGENYNLQTAYLRGECGMRGMSITDFSGSSKYMDVADGLMGGSDIWDSPMPMIHTVNASGYAGDPCMVKEMREAMHNILYTVVNSNAMNGWTSETYIAPNTPWWQTAIYALIGVTAILTIGSAFMLAQNIRRKKEQGQVKTERS